MPTSTLQRMLAFTFPGQGSQRPGMGRPWVDHESWELVDEASEVAERDVARLLLDADADELNDTRNAQLTTFVSSLMVLDAVERLGVEPSFCAGHSLGEYTALTATGALGFDDGVRLVERARRGDARGRPRQPGHDGRGARPRRRPGRGRLPPGRQRRVGRQLQRARTGRHRRLARRRGRGAGASPRSSAPRRSCRCRCRGAFHTPFMAPARDRLRKAIAEADPRDTEVPVVSNVDALAPPRGRGVVEPALGAAVTARCAGSTACSTLERPRCHRLRRARSGRRAHRHGQAHGRRRRARSRCRRPKISTSCSSGSTPARRARPAQLEGEHLFASRTPRRQPGRRRVHADSPDSPTAPPSRSAPCSATSATPRCGRRSPASLQSYIAVDGERVTLRQPIAWLRTV